MEKFLKLNLINYKALPHSEESEIEHNLSHKNEWLLAGKQMLSNIARKIKSIQCEFHLNSSGSIDRGYVSGFFTKNNKIVYISINDGMQNILYRTADSFTDYTGGSNHTVSITEEGIEEMIDWINSCLND